MLCGIQSVQETARSAVFAFAGLLVFAMTARGGPETKEADAPRGKDLFRTNQTLIMAPLPRLAQNDQSKQPSLPSSEFNPDTGAKDQVVPIEPPDLFPPILPQLPDYGEEALPRSLQLPRKGVREAVPRRTKLEYEAYPDSESGAGLPLGAEPVPNRWFIGFGRWQRYADPSTETPYQQGALRRWHPYLQSKLKGDAPIIGQDVFLNLTLTDFFQAEFRKLPLPSGVSTARPNSSEFFGRSQQRFFSNDVSIGIDLFKGETAFKPVEWAIRLLGVYNVNYIRVEETNVLDPDPRGPDFSSSGNPSIFVPGATERWTRRRHHSASGKSR